jgi:hypothetical protein
MQKLIGKFCNLPRNSIGTIANLLRGPYRPDAWIDHAKNKMGCEIPFNRHFYTYQPSRPPEEVEAGIKTLETEILDMLGEVTHG